MGSTIRAAVKLCRRRDAAWVVAVVPVPSRDVAQGLDGERGGPPDEIFVLEQPKFFRAVAQAYERWYDVPDSEVTAIMDRWRREDGP